MRIISFARVAASSKGLFCICFLLLLCSCSEREQPTPNILFILADDLGYFDLSYTGSRFYETPNIDRLASEAMVFTEGYAACQVCSPSRASIMTGQFPARHGITDWIGAASGEDWRKQKRFNRLLPASYVHDLPASIVTLPEALKAGGYRTFFAGKWHLGDKGSWPEDHGFDVNKGGWDKGSPVGGYFSPWVNPSLENHRDGENLSMRLANETVDHLKQNDPSKTGQPVFAFLSFYAVHGPIQTTRQKWAKYRQKAEEAGIAKTGFVKGSYLPMRVVQDNPVYGGLVEQMDDAVGVVLDALDDLGIADNTIVVFTSDNGGVSAGDSYSTSNLPFRGGKGYQFEGGIREPYFIKVPGTTNGAACAVPVTGTDFYPTLLELAGLDLKPEEHIDGQSLVPLLKGGNIPDRPLIWHYPHYGNQGGDPSSVIREGEWKLIHYYEDGHQELFNLKADEQENADVSAANPEVVKRLSDKLFSYLDDVGASLPEQDPQYDAEREKEYLHDVFTRRMQGLEQQRLDYLSKDFDPKNNWWGSEGPKESPTD